jgi:hypothetical protein
MLREQDIQNAIRLAVGGLDDVRLWRNSTGSLPDSRGVRVRFGLAVGSSDLVGILAPSGRLLSLEVKTARGRTTSEQETWMTIVRRFGGFACVVRSAEEALAAVDRARKGESC